MRRSLLFVIGLAACGDDGLTFVDAPPQIADAAADGATIDSPELDAPAIDATPLDAAVIDAPTIDAPTIDAPTIDAPTTDAPTTDAPTTDAPTTDAPTTDAPTTDAPTTDAPTTDAPTIDAPTTDAVMQQQFYWADWTSAQNGLPGSGSGTFSPPSGTVNFNYSGEIRFAQTSGGTNYWLPAGPYINAVTANGPSPNTDIIALQGSAITNTVTFDPPVTGLVMGILSLGSGGANVKYVFDTNIALLSYGQGYFGNGVIVVEGTNTISGSEGHGAIQLAGTVSSISWTITNAEYWHGFTLGIPNQ